MSAPDFQLKGSTVTVVVLELHRYAPEEFSAQLEARIRQAPQLFEGSPVVISLESLDVDHPEVDFEALLTQCRALELRPIAFRALPPRFSAAAAATGLAVLPPGTARGRNIPSREAAPAAAEPEPAVELHTESSPQRPGSRPTRTITRPVRSGQQIYAEGGDLIVLAQVSEGAEVLADGNIHIYGALRGRALAGVHGDASARIFCQNMDAELISVAGHFLLSDALTESVHRKPAQVALQGDVLNVSAL
ncbi:septum site-determining protein MinC [Parahaliea sp. F7430]|uniref:Probable septum site-determining protein MinC n=1 Tax=Sediminihaliea albiluteola TaxID=2758564 RepID=A0A7W2TZ10_9GAMM|nr:septum site-determining protein MinC [Sediminihaliea albiluteola]MBA6414374.1 septum site-determining protein MinC [Sediminihaliea albiluteola]